MHTRFRRWGTVRDRGSLLALVLVSAATFGCSGIGPDPFVPDAGSIARVEREFGMTIFVYATPLEGVDDGGSRPIQFVDSRGESLLVWWDGRLVILDPDMPDGGIAQAAARRTWWLHAYPESPGSIQVPRGSSADSAITDLLRSAYRFALTPEHEDLLLREDAWVAATNLRGRIQREDILKRRTLRESEAMTLRRFAVGTRQSIDR